MLSPAALRVSGFVTTAALPQVRRALVAGSAWGLAMGAGLAAFGLWECGTVCLTDAAMTTGISIATGIATIGPLAVFWHTPAP
jgi:hypothetical protein